MSFVELEATAEIIENENELSKTESAIEANVSSYNKEYKECIEEFHKLDKNNKKEKFVRCKLCFSMPNIVKINSDNKKLAPMATIEGTRYRHRYVADHFQSKYHLACRMAISVPSNTKASIDFHVSKSDEKLVSHVTKLLFEIYVDAKKLTCSAYSWPARFVSSDAGRSFNYKDVNAPTILPSLNLQYTNPKSYSSLLNNIVKSDKSNFQNKLETSIAASIRIDGSVDRTQVDKIYVMLKIITANGEKELIFLGIAEQNSRGAAGLFDAVKKAIIESVGEEMYVCIMKKISSICTDGTNINSGERGGLWALFENEIRRIGSTSSFTKVWCSAHRMDLVWGDVCETQININTVLDTISSISSYFHKSGIRMSELKKIATEKNLKLLSIPKLFTIRWTEYSFNILNNLLLSWNVLVLYFDAYKGNNRIEMGYFNFLTKFKNLQIISFLADFLQVFSRHHKKTQNDNLTIVSLVQSIRSLRNSLVGLKERCLIGGWEAALNNGIKQDDGKLTLNEFELLGAMRSRIAEKMDFKTIRKGIIDSTIDGLSQRFASDDEIMETIEPFLNFEKETDLRQLYALFGPDLDLSSLQLQFDELIDQNIYVKLAGDFGQIIKTLSKNTIYKDIVIAMSRIHVLTPHSADVERCISANNLIKTPLRNAISIETENKYLYIYFNMPTLENWDPRPAIRMWMNDKSRKDRSDIIKGKSTHAPYFKGVFEAIEKETATNDEQIHIIKKF